MIGFIVVVGIIVIVWYLAHTGKKERLRQQHKEMERLAIQRSLNVIYESIDLAKNSKNPSTKKSRIAVAIEVAEQLAQDYPDHANYSTLSDDLLKIREDIHTDCIIQSVVKFADKANTARTTATRISNASKALAEIEEGIRDDFANKPKLKIINDQLEDFIHKVQLDELKEKAEKLEFKGNHAKAADAYMDALYFLHKDHIDDTLQIDEINALQDKVQTMQDAARNKPPKQAKGRQSFGSVMTNEDEINIALVPGSDKKQ